MKGEQRPDSEYRGSLVRGMPLRLQVRNGQIVPTVPEAISVHGGSAPKTSSDDGQTAAVAGRGGGPMRARADIQPPQPAHLRVKLRGRGREYLAATAFFTGVLAIVGLAGYGALRGLSAILQPSSLSSSTSADPPAAKLNFDTSALYEACERVVRSRLHYPTSFSVKLFTTSYGRSTITNEPLVRFDFDALNGFGLRVPQVARCIQRATGLEVYVDVE
jgi:hypothetical protein